MNGKVENPIPPGPAGCDREEFRRTALAFLSARLEVEATAAAELDHLAVLSIKKRAGLPDRTRAALLETRMGRYDCHQFTAAIRKKVLLILSFEKFLGIALAEEDREKIRTVDDLLRLSYSCYLWREKAKRQCGDPPREES